MCLTHLFVLNKTSLLSVKTMKFFNSAIVHIILAASTVAASKEAIIDDTKAAKSLRGKNNGSDKRRGLKSAKSDDPSAWEPAPDPWAPAPDPWYPSDDYVEPDPWGPAPDPWYPSDDYVEPDPWAPAPDPWYPSDDYVEPDPWAPAPDPWYPEPDPWAPKPKHPKIKKLLMQKAAKGAKGSKSMKGQDYDPWYPTDDYVEPVPPHRHPEQCKYFKIKLGAIQAPSQETIGTAADLGAEFIYNSPLFEDANLTDPVGPDPNNPDAFVTGICTRFQQSRELEGGDVIAGAGQCDWTYTINVDGLEGTLQVEGEVFDSVKSTLAITGGTNVFVGAAGQLEMIPSPEGTNIDIFTEVNYYNISAVVYIQECDPTHYTWWKNHQGYWDWNG
jgi:hypothetical protein